MKQTWIVHHDWRGGWWAEVPGNGDLVAFSDTRRELDAAIDAVLAQRRLRETVVSKCTSDCKAPTPFQAHCSLCHLTFGGITGFDLHRRGGQCSHPSTFDYVERDQVWREEMDQHKIEMFRNRVKGTRGKKSGVE